MACIQSPSSLFILFFHLRFPSFSYFFICITSFIQLFRYALTSFFITSYLHYFILCEFIPCPLDLISFSLFFIFFSNFFLFITYVYACYTCHLLSAKLNFIRPVLWCGFRGVLVLPRVRQWILILLFDAYPLPSSAGERKWHLAA